MSKTEPRSLKEVVEDLDRIEDEAWTIYKENHKDIRLNEMIEKHEKLRDEVGTRQNHLTLPECLEVRRLAEEASKG